MNRYTARTYGGAVVAYTNTIVEILNCSFSGNGAVRFGGAIYT